ncbi:MAG: enoyl-ACP reductase FabI [Oricola sp.]|nr:enoyl-ACP reductase FabI [Oricola sp.]
MNGLMAGKRGLIMGVANDHSIAWGIAKALHAQGAEIALTYQGEAFGRRVKPLAEEIDSKLLLPCDVEDTETVKAVFDTLKEEWGSLDFLVHAIGFSDRNELKGRYLDVTTRENFSRTMVISAYSFTEVAQHAAPMLNEGGSLLTLTYGGSMRVMPNYNVMGIAKAALEAMVRYLAADFGRNKVRVNAISAGPVRTLAGAGIGDARQIFSYQQRVAPLGRPTDISQVGQSALYLLSDMSSGVTGEIHYVDAGYNVMSMPMMDELRKLDPK